MKTTMVKASTSSSNALWTLCAYFGTLLALFLISNIVFAGGTSSQEGSLGDVADTITTSMTGVAKLITATSYVAGVGFALMGMLKLKAHKDNPTQVSLSQPIVLLAIAAGLVFLPSLIKTAGSTVWKGGGDTVGATGTGGESLGKGSSGG
ncbi:type IV secretion protein IcmD [Candidatus Berkiella aquae]|uniref:Type IV secretion protein IcmD n=1 Tax=Candidatus Berkiella aquae TaxID=295108 RepID=A0A0Q9YWD0_9GAMM|nr:type IV secretion protein IcmD [Candidatus Berkiella aquae]MCS5711119.1 type IV secretion protein IcmD [Candidatus Berkiella aquae]